MDYVLAVDAGSTQSGYCLVETATYKPLEFGKIDNQELMDRIIDLSNNYSFHLAIEQFAFYGSKNPIGQTTIEAITWNGKYIRQAELLGIGYTFIFRKEEKMNLCKTMRCGDKQIKDALIKRFATFDFKRGKGTKKKPDWFYGFAADMWSAYAIGVTYLDEINKQSAI